MIQLDKIYNMDCLELMRQMPDDSVDCIITDPPYGIGYKSNHGSKEYQERTQKTDWDIDFDFSLYFNEFWRVLKDNSFMYVWGRFENYNTMMRLGCNRVLIWNKMHNGMGDLNDWGIGYELIYLFKKGRPLIKGKRVNGIINLQHISFFEKTLHPTQKSESIIRYIIKKSCNKNDIVLDGFMGSGTTAVACKQLNRRFIGAEISKEYCDIANKRLQQNNLKEWFPG